MTTSNLYRIAVTLDSHDESVAGTRGDTEFITPTQCLIDTDDIDALYERLDADDNVLMYSLPEAL